MDKIVALLLWPQRRRRRESQVQTWSGVKESKIWTRGKGFNHKEFSLGQLSVRTPKAYPNSRLSCCLLSARQENRERRPSPIPRPNCRRYLLGSFIPRARAPQPSLSPFRTDSLHRHLKKICSWSFKPLAIFMHFHDLGDRLCNAFFLDMCNCKFTQGYPLWPFAHLTDAFGSIHTAKQNVLMHDGRKGSFENEQDTFRKGIDLNNGAKKLVNSTFVMSSESKKFIDEERFVFENHASDAREPMKAAQVFSLNSEMKGYDYQDVPRKGMNKHVVQEIVKGVYTVSGSSSQEKSWRKGETPDSMDFRGQSVSVQLGKALPLESLSSSKSERSRRHSVNHIELTEQSWEYAFTSEPVPIILTGKSFCSRQSYQGLQTEGLACPSKISLRKLPLRSSEKHMPANIKMLKIDSLPKAARRPAYKHKESKTNWKQKMQTVNVIKQLVCGGFAGVISRTAVAPLDLIKTYLITSHSLRGCNKSAWTICKDILDQDGWQGLFRGNLVNCIRVAPSKAIELCVFETVRRLLNKEGHPLKHMAATVAGGAAGMAGTIVTYPLELLRTRISVQPELYSSLSQAIRKIAQDEGFLAFYSGLSPSLVGVFPYAATNYFVYDGLRTAYRRSTGKNNVPTEATLVFGAVAAAASSAVTYPLEVARRQMQLSLTGAFVKKSTVGVILDIYQHEGFLALYRGLGTTWLKLIPAAGISFVCYETARLALQIDDASLVKLEVMPEQEGQAFLKSEQRSLYRKGEFFDSTGMEAPRQQLLMFQGPGGFFFKKVPMVVTPVKSLQTVNKGNQTEVML
ncbi:hypothetical protein GOP47_0013388 [Adiantum capillus-veneris]|uniref:Mitochondrial substrate carrier family protein n=1 Tax=Adiantum capillus-veneris TaxID=13818 RepID=A0A9D4ZEH6_ADICA|nr:hypothetical protein GOP47_0013388 [Adiantum capillus-veneris]